MDPLPDNGIDTILKLFRSSAAKCKNIDFMGTRDQSKPEKPYVWKTWHEIDELVTKVGRGMYKLNLCPLTAGE